MCHYVLFLSAPYCFPLAEPLPSQRVPPLLIYFHGICIPFLLCSSPFCIPSFSFIQSAVLSPTWKAKHNRNINSIPVQRVKTRGCWDLLANQWSQISELQSNSKLCEVESCKERHTILTSGYHMHTFVCAHTHTGVYIHNKFYFICS